MIILEKINEFEHLITCKKCGWYSLIFSWIMDKYNCVCWKCNNIKEIIVPEKRNNK